MKKLLCLTTALCLGALSAQAQGWGYVPQNVQRPAYRVPVQAQKQQQYRPTNTAPVVQRQEARQKRRTGTYDGRASRRTRLFG